MALFRRVGRRLELTETGKLALSYAEEIFQTGAELEDLLKNGAEERFITFRVGIADVVPKFIAHRLLAPVLELPKAVRLVCQEDRLERLLAIWRFTVSTWCWPTAPCRLARRSRATAIRSVNRGWLSWPHPLWLHD